MREVFAVVSRPRLKSYKLWLGLLILLGIALAMGFYGWGSGLKQLLLQVEKIGDSLGRFAPVAMIVLCGIWGTLLLPGPLMQTTVATLFVNSPATALVVVVAGEAVAQLCAFTITRALGREKIKALMEGKQWFNQLEAGIRVKGAYAVFLFRLMPFLPNALASYALGITSLRLGPYMIASVLGSIPKMVAYVYGATAILRALLDGDVPAWELILVALLALGAVSASRLVLMEWRRRKAKQPGT